MLRVETLVHATNAIGETRSIRLQVQHLTPLLIIEL